MPGVDGDAIIAMFAASMTGVPRCPSLRKLVLMRPTGHR